MNITYGCIGEVLKHSFSKEIHNALADYDYKIIEIPRDKLADFANEKNFKAINVTIPYKEAIMPFMYSIDEHAKAIGSVNTVVNREGKLYGYNTDFYGMSMLLRHAGISLLGKKIAILGTGGTSKTAYAVAKAEGAREILTVSRKKSESAITYDELYENHTDTEVIINTTPVGMYPNICASAVDIKSFPSLVGVIDAVYNPLRSSLISDAKEAGIKAEGGLYMLVAQAVKASEFFINTVYDEKRLDEVFAKTMRDKENIVLIGMPASGKSTVGKSLSKELNRAFFDTDAMIEEKYGKSIPEIFALWGEKKFREIECEAVCEASAKTGVVIATGGGAILNSGNVKNLKKNGRLYFLDRPLDKLTPTDDRPLSKSVDAIKALYEKRYPIYTAAADKIIVADEGILEVVGKITEDFCK